MPYNESALAKLKHLKELAQKVVTDYAKKTDLDSLSQRVGEIEEQHGEKNKIEVVKVNGSALDISPDDRSVDVKVPTAVSGLTNDSGYQTESDVTEKIKAQLTAVLKPGGSFEFASLPEPSKENLGTVYNVTDKFTADEKFIEGESGKEYPAGTNVAVIDAGSEDYKFDVYSGFVDLSGLQPKEAGKGLSTKDYTAEDQQKLAGIHDGATKVEASETPGSVKVNGADVAVVTIATDEEATEMLNEVFTPGE